MALAEIDRALLNPFLVLAAEPTSGDPSSLSNLHLVSGRGLRRDQAASRRLWSLRQLCQRRLKTDPPLAWVPVEI